MKRPRSSLFLDLTHPSPSIPIPQGSDPLVHSRQRQVSLQALREVFDVLEMVDEEVDLSPEAPWWPGGVPLVSEKPGRLTVEHVGFFAWKMGI